MNLLANKELISLRIWHFDCGFVVSWVSFLCQDHDLQALWRQGIHQNLYPRTAGQPGREPVLLGVLAHARHVGRLLRHGMIEVNTALNATIGGTWYVVLGSSLGNARFRRGQLHAQPVARPYAQKE